MFNVLTLDPQTKIATSTEAHFIQLEEDCCCVKILIWLVRPHLLIACTCTTEKHHLFLLLQLHINMQYAMTNEHTWFPSLTP